VSEGGIGFHRQEVSSLLTLSRQRELRKHDRVWGLDERETYVAQRVVTTTLVPFAQATMSGLRSMQPPVAKPAQLTPMGAIMDISKGKGADVLSGIASLNVRLALASVKEDMVRF
jgi:hypothetical protein